MGNSSEFKMAVELVIEFVSVAASRVVKEQTCQFQ